MWWTGLHALISHRAVLVGDQFLGRSLMPHTGIRVGFKWKLAPAPPGWGTPWKTIYIENPNNGCQINNSERLKEGYKSNELRCDSRTWRDGGQGSQKTTKPHSKKVGVNGNLPVLQKFSMLDWVKTALNGSCIMLKWK